MFNLLNAIMQNAIHSNANPFNEDFYISCLIGYIADDDFIDFESSVVWYNAEDWTRHTWSSNTWFDSEDLSLAYKDALKQIPFSNYKIGSVVMGISTDNGSVMTTKLVFDKRFQTEDLDDVALAFQRECNRLDKIINNK